MKYKRVAIVCDWIKDWWWAELVLEQILDIFPNADIFTSVFWQQENPIFKNRKITTSFIQRLPLINKSHKLALTLRPIAFESFDLSKYDIVISSSSAESKWVITKPWCLHICYCHTPTRYFWSHYHDYLHYMEFGFLNHIWKWLMPRIVHKLRSWDFCAAQRPDYFIANSENTASRIKKYYNRKSKVIYPCIDIDNFKITPPSVPTLPGDGSLKMEEIKKFDEYYIYIWRCIPYKKFDLVVDSFNENWKKIIILTNTENKLYNELKSRSNSNITWKLNISNNEKLELLSNAKALIFPPEEDFWLVPIESMACWTPVIAYGKWWALETVKAPHPPSGTSPQREEEYYTWIFFKEQTVENLNETIDKFETMIFDTEEIKKYTEKFDKKVFKKELLHFIEDKLKK